MESKIIFSKPVANLTSSTKAVWTPELVAILQGFITHSSSLRSFLSTFGPEERASKFGSKDLDDFVLPDSFFQDMGWDWITASPGLVNKYGEDVREILETKVKRKLREIWNGLKAREREEISNRPIDESSADDDDDNSNDEETARSTSDDNDHVYSADHSQSGEYAEQSGYEFESKSETESEEDEEIAAILSRFNSARAPGATTGSIARNDDDRVTAGPAPKQAKTNIRFASPAAIAGPAVGKMDDQVRVGLAPEQPKTKVKFALPDAAVRTTLPATMHSHKDNSNSDSTSASSKPERTTRTSYSNPSSTLDFRAALQSEISETKALIEKDQAELNQIVLEIEKLKV